jgi:response regulator RpfG family c-di-GMP phosphodiesterase
MSNTQQIANTESSTVDELTFAVSEILGVSDHEGVDEIRTAVELAFELAKELGTHVDAEEIATLMPEMSF